jgi:muramoyltetrapeptide carboxypeptidase
VALVAPAGPLSGESDLQRAIDSAHALGWQPIIGEHVREKDGYLAGSDAQRVADFNRAAADDSIDAVWCIRGGYGAMRLLDAVDYDAWCRHPKALIGYSDITALHAAVGARAELVTYHGPTARSSLTNFCKSSLLEAVACNGPYTLEAVSGKVLRPGKARGRLVGGNLALLAGMTGTPFAPSYDGAILVLEDVNESVYRLDRMLTQLRLNGALASLAGLLLGQFTDIPEDPSNEDRPLSELLEELAGWCDVPCLANVPVGHVSDIWTLPLGATAELDVDTRTLTVVR